MDPISFLKKWDITLEFDDDGRGMIDVSILRRGEPIGEVDLAENDGIGAYQIQLASIADEESDGEFGVPRGKGIGTAVYLAVRDYIRRKYRKPIASDFTRSQHSERVWKALVRKGTARGPIRLDPNVKTSYYQMERIFREDPGGGSRFLARPLGLVRRGWNRRERGSMEGSDEAFQWWKEDGPRRGLRGLDPDRILVCRVLIDSAEEFKRLTGRGSGGRGFVVDTEVFWASKRQRGLPEGEIDWVFHNEQRANDLEQAQSVARRMMEWIDRRSVRSLSEVPRSGPLSMSKPPKTEGRAWARLIRLVNG